MKRIGPLLLGLIWIHVYGWAQLVPEPAFDWIDANNVNARINSNGAIFHDFENGQFSVNGGPSTIRALGFWYFGLDPAANLKGAAQLYNEDFKADFWPGYLDYPDGTVSNDFNGVWKVTKSDIDAFLQAWENAQQAGQPLAIEDIPLSILAWPARGNAFFSDYNEDDLPNTSQRMANFWDHDGDGIYDPTSGDYPFPGIRMFEFDDIAIPDQMLWTVTNDMRDIHSESWSAPGRHEVQITAFAYNCTDNEILNNTVFLHFLTINANVESLDSLYQGIFADFDIGCPEDDYFGSIPGLQTLFVYNADNEDEGCDGYEGFGENPPVQAITFLRGPLDINGEYVDFGVSLGLDETDPALSLPTSQTLGFYNLLSGTGSDGTSLENEGRYYTDNPGITNGWSEYALGNEAGDRRTLGAYRPVLSQPGAVNEMLVAVTYHRRPGANHLENVNEVYANTWKLLQLMETGFADPCTVTACDTCIWPGDTDHDGIVSNLDILPIGLGFGQSGPERENASTAWLPQQGEDWVQNLDVGTNFKHLDANGDGVINSSDALVVEDNYGLYYDDTMLPPVTNPGQDLYLVPSVDTLEPGESFDIEIVLGSEGDPVDDIYGLVFSVTYDPELLYFTGTDFDGGWFADGDEVLYVAQDVPQLNQIQFGLSRIDQTNVSGQGVIGSFSLTVKDDIMGRNTTIETLLELINIKGISNDEADLGLGGKNLPLIIATPDIVNAVDDADDEFPVFLYPNPAREVVNVQLPTVEHATIEIFDTMGKMVFRQDAKTPTMTIATDHFGPGIYLLKVQLKEVSWRRKFLVLW